MHKLVLAVEACFELVVAFLVMHFYSAAEDADSNSDLVDGLVATAEVYIAIEGLVAEVA